jgi:segregation and condensation protein B
VSKRKKSNVETPPSDLPEDNESVTTRAVVPPEVRDQAMGGRSPVEHDATPEGDGSADANGGGAGGLDAPYAPDEAPTDTPPQSAGLSADEFDVEMTLNLVGDLPMPGRDDLDAPTFTASGEMMAEVDDLVAQRKHLRGLLEALVFASDSPIGPKELAKLAHAQQKQVREVLGELQADYATRGIHLDEVAGGWVFRTSPKYAPFVRDLTKQKPVRLTRAQVETLAIIAYRQPITRPEIDDVRGVDSGPVLKLLLERDLVRILGKRDEVGRPLIYGTTGQFLEFFGLKSLKDLPTLREFTELSDESREAFEDELGEAADGSANGGAQAEANARLQEEDAGLGEHEAGYEPGPPSLAPDSLELLGDDDDASEDDGPKLTSEAPGQPDDPE